ncbi:hypothetical protein [Paeniglutamicibacter antarcticus]|uniref:Uncharacterized protein n=1 Tax=Paeniglutamicibacter antarcticus TaxID=494023 RepID=A0ABP9TQ35_9MICC
MSEAGPWIEAIVLFQTIRGGNQPAAKQLMDSSADKEQMVDGLMSLLGVFLKGKDPSELDRFLVAAHRFTPPPGFGTRPYLPPLS